jgi:hypothetical protein
MKFAETGNKCQTQNTSRDHRRQPAKDTHAEIEIEGNRVPDTGDRFMLALIFNQDHSMIPVEYAPVEFTLTQEQIGTRYVILALRTFMDATDKDEIAKANALQDQVTVSQAEVGSLDVPEWDMDSLLKVRNALAVLAATVYSHPRKQFGFSRKRSVVCVTG